MHAYVFVYSPSKFQIGSHPLVRFEAGSTYSEDRTAIAAETEGVVDRGIYAIGADAVEMAPEIDPLESRITIDYDLFLVRGKDPWPTLIDPGATTDDAMRRRVAEAFPSLRDEHLKGFLSTQHV